MKSVLFFLWFIVLPTYTTAQYNYVQLRNIETNELIDIPLGTNCFITFDEPERTGLETRSLKLTGALVDTLVFEDSILLAFSNIKKLAIPNPNYIRGQLIYGSMALLIVPLSYLSIHSEEKMVNFIVIGIITGIYPAFIITYLSLQARAARGGNKILLCKDIVLRSLVRDNQNINISKSRNYFNRN